MYAHDAIDSAFKFNALFLIMIDTSPLTSGYLVVANRLYLHRISFDGSRTNVVVGGLSYAITVDYHFRNNSLYWIDSGKQAIMKSTLDGLKRATVLDHGLNQPGRYKHLNHR